MFFVSPFSSILQFNRQNYLTTTVFACFVFSPMFECWGNFVWLVCFRFLRKHMFCPSGFCFPFVFLDYFLSIWESTKNDKHQNNENVHTGSVCFTFFVFVFFRRFSKIQILFAQVLVYLRSDEKQTKKGLPILTQPFCLLTFVHRWRFFKFHSKDRSQKIKNIPSIGTFVFCFGNCRPFSSF